MEDDHLGGGYLRHPEKMRLRVCERVEKIQGGYVKDSFIFAEIPENP